MNSDSLRKLAEQAREFRYSKQRKSAITQPTLRWAWDDDSVADFAFHLQPQAPGGSTPSKSAWQVADLIVRDYGRAREGSATWDIHRENIRQLLEAFRIASEPQAGSEREEILAKAIKSVLDRPCMDCADCKEILELALANPTQK